MARETKTRAEIEAMIRDELKSDPTCADFEFGVSSSGSLYSVREGQEIHPCFGKAAELAAAFASKYEIAED